LLVGPRIDVRRKADVFGKLEQRGRGPELLGGNYLEGLRIIDANDLVAQRRLNVEEGG